jgi:hypothetical protein
VDVRRIAQEVEVRGALEVRERREVELDERDGLGEGRPARRKRRQRGREHERVEAAAQDPPWH